MNVWQGSDTCKNWFLYLGVQASISALMNTKGDKISWKKKVKNNYDDTKNSDLLIERDIRVIIMIVKPVTENKQWWMTHDQ